ncbi:MAG: serine/threonine protein kinase/WD40 repeat protein [Planctomycetota bacterium]|jgi:serine/threonine protein kinase/WD40 repeat protein
MTPQQFERVEAVFSKACSLPSGEREAFLDQQCADDALVRAEVAAMLVADDSGADELLCEGPALPGAVTLVDGVGAESRSRAIPARIGRYRIIRECGHGGMGVVYEAEQESPSRRVALKVIRTGALSPEILRRFQHEADALGRLQHPGIAQIFEAGSFEVGDGGQPFLAMEFVDGQDLLEYAAAQDLDMNARLALFTLVCEAVHYAHQKGVIHRDLKPDNILVASPSQAIQASSATRVPTPTGSLADRIGQPKILDFGIARIADPDAQLTSMLTHAGQLVGTPQYMSPEQASQGTREIDARSDVYTLGVVLFQLLVGHPPYDLSGCSISESINLIRNVDSPPIRSAGAGFKGDIDTIVAKCLEKEPDGRYSSAAELAEDIRRHLQNEPIAARPPSRWYLLKKFTRRNQGLVGGALATFAALVIGLIASTIFALRASENATRAAGNEAAALREAYVARLTATSALADTDPYLARQQLEAAPEALRGWEWRHLASRLKRYARTYEADVPSTGPMAYFAGGTRMVSALVDGRVAVWDAETTELIRVGTDLAGSQIVTLAVPSGGSPLVACGTEAGRVRVWDLNADTWFDVSTEASPIHEVAWDSGGDRLLFSTKSGALRLWSRGGPIRDHSIEMLPQFSRPSKLGFSPDGTWYSATTVSQQGGLAYWFDSESGEQLSASSELFPAVRAQGLSHDSTRIAATGLRGLRSCTVLSARTNELELVLRGHGQGIAAVAWTPDDAGLFTSSHDGTVRYWNTATGASLATLEADRSSPLAVSPNGSGLVFRLEGTLRYWDLALTSATVLHPNVNYVYHLTYAPDGARLAAASIYSTHATIMDPRLGRIVRTLDVSDSDGICFSRDAAQLFLLNGLWPSNELSKEPGWKRSGLTKWASTIEVATGSVGVPPVSAVQDWKRPPRGGARYGPGWVISADGGRRAKAGYHRVGSNALVSDVALGETILEVEGDFHGVALSPDGALLAAAHGEPGRIEIWSLTEMRKLLELPAHGNSAYCVEFHPDGTRLATGGNDSVIRLWDTATWEPVLELRGHTSYVKTVVFSPDGTQLASGSGDLTVRIWDTIPRAERYREAMAAQGR